MKVILLQDVENLGKAGDIIEVANGYGRNYLIPKKLAVLADTKNVKMFEHQKRMVEAKVRRMREKAKTLAEKLEGLELTIPAKVGEEGKLFGSVTSSDIAEELSRMGYDVDRKQIELESAIKSVGEYTVRVRVASGVTAELKVTVTPEE
ncbi:MAG: 50S ribosomal protein L9 [Deltaproteobacteria bacterium]|nr:MAG: 50S ribosomal protein L9 [Deltaproteobacteria bacterium]